jgi:diguanylate cyclase (GGDEF)-like protein
MPIQADQPFIPGAAPARTPLETAAGLNAAALKIRNISPGEARRLYEKAYDLARDDLSCCSEAASSLAGQGYLNNNTGDVNLAVKQNFEAISLLANSPPAPPLVDAYCNLAWIFDAFGAFSNALNYASKALKTAQQLQDQYWEARALDTYGNSWFSGAADLDETFQFQEKAAHLFGEIGDTIEQARVYNNIADAQLRGGRLETALEYGQKSLALARQTHSPIIEIVAIITLAEVLIAMQAYVRAENSLQEALELLSDETPIIFKVDILISLAQVCLMNSHPGQAEANLVAAIQIASSVQSIYEQAMAHRILAEIYEQKQEFSTALEHHKQFTVLNEKLLTEKADKQFYALKIASNLETAQRDAEIHRLKTVELQKEIKERERIQKELETLAVRDPLTGLYNRRQFFHLAEYEIEQVRRFNRPVALALIDLDNFKQVNDTYGHLTGDTVLSSIGSIFQRSMRAIDIVSRYGGEEFAILMPETDAAMCEMVIQRARKKLDEQGVNTEHGVISVTFSAGIACFDHIQAGDPVDVETLIKRADLALYRAKGAGKNRTSVY